MSDSLRSLVEYSAEHVFASVVCADEAIYDGQIIREAQHGVWLSVGGDPDRVVFFPWTSVNRLVLKKF